jgi:hypothetical protein
MRAPIPAEIFRSASNQPKPKKIILFVDFPEKCTRENMRAPIPADTFLLLRLGQLIGCFPNGNGRHSRLMADLIMEKLYGEAFFTWGSSDLVKSNDKRRAYINAIKKADNHYIQDLISFAKS